MSAILDVLCAVAVWRHPLIPRSHQTWYLSSYPNEIQRR